MTDRPPILRPGARVDWTEVTELLRSLPSLEALGVHPAILEVAGEIADSSDVPGLSLSTLEDLVRAILSLDRLDREGRS